MNTHTVRRISIALRAPHVVPDDRELPAPLKKRLRRRLPPVPVSQTPGAPRWQFHAWLRHAAASLADLAVVAMLRRGPALV